MTDEADEMSAASRGSVSVEKRRNKMAYETVPLQQRLREIASRTASEQDADAIRLAADTLDERGISGEIIEMDYSEEIGVYFGSLRCQKCETEMQVRPCVDRPRCKCGIEWDFDVSATGTQF
jgi:hypothetical protein